MPIPTSGTGNTGQPSVLSCGTHLGTLVLTLTRARWQVLELHLGMPTVSCHGWTLAVRFVARETSSRTPTSLLRAKLHHRGASPQERAGPTPAPPAALGAGSHSPFPREGHLEKDGQGQPRARQEDQRYQGGTDIFHLQPTGKKQRKKTGEEVPAEQSGWAADIKVTCH